MNWLALGAVRTMTKFFMIIPFPSCKHTQLTKIALSRCTYFTALI